MSNVLVVSGSPRKNGNTATLARHVVDGARGEGASVRVVDLWDLKFSGCTSCFACKRAGGASYGRCAVNDELSPVLEEIHNAGALVLVAPIYLCSLPGTVRSFYERIIYPYYVYDDARSSLFPRKIWSALIVSMNLKRENTVEWNYDDKFAAMTHFLRKIYGHCDFLAAYNTWQFDDYAKYYAPTFKVEDKARQRREQFPADCEAAFELGRKFSHERPE